MTPMSRQKTPRLSLAERWRSLFGSKTLGVQPHSPVPGFAPFSRRGDQKPVAVALDPFAIRRTSTMSEPSPIISFFCFFRRDPWPLA
jgi:hypothetical protein